MCVLTPLLAAATAAPLDNRARLLLDDTPVTGCGGFADLAVDIFAFDRYPDYFDANTTFTLADDGSKISGESTLNVALATKMTQINNAVHILAHS